MASAEFCYPIRPPRDGRSQWQESRPPRVRHVTFTLIPAASTTAAPCKYRALKILDSSPAAVASYAISVRQASALPSASFRFHLAMDTLAVRLMVPLTGPIGELHPQVIRPAPPAPEQRRQGATRHAWRTTKSPLKMLPLNMSHSDGLVCGDALKFLKVMSGEVEI